jgi:D-alanyl-D-alanine carboxypeptidase
MAERHALEALLPPSTDNTAGLLARCNAGSQDAFTAKMHATASRLGRTGPRPRPPDGQSGSRHESEGRLKGHPERHDRKVPPAQS